MNAVLATCLIMLSMVLPFQGTLPDAPKADTTPRVYQPGGDVVPPKLVFSVDPEYTKEAEEQRVRGVTELSLTVDAEGNARDVKVSRSLAEDVEPKKRHAAKGLDDKAVQAVRQYRFKPGTLKGKPVAVAIHVSVNFQLF